MIGMEKIEGERIERLLNRANVLNNGVMTLTRCMILSLIAYARDGVQYRELKAVLKISDGKLATNLRKLFAGGYLRKEEVELEKRKLDVYYLTGQGEQEVKNVIAWMQTLKEVAAGEC